MRNGALALFVLILVAALAYLQGKSSGSSLPVSGAVTPTKEQAPPSGDGAPIFWFPQKEQYVTKENDPFLVLVGISVASPSETRFVLLEPTPSFVQLRPLCSPPDSSFAQTLITIAPRAGDAGKYEVSLGAGRGEEKPTAPFLTLIVRVKKA